MPRKRGVDKILLTAVIALLSVGLITLFSASFELSEKEFGNPFGYVVHQLIYGVAIGFVFGMVGYRVPWRVWEKLAFPIFIGSLLLMILVFVPGIGVASGGAHRWINLGFVTFQPSEIIKIAFIFYLAAWITSHQNDLKKNPFSVLPFLILVGILGIFLLLQPDLGTFGVIALTAAGMYFSAKTPLKHIASIGALGVLAFYVLVKVAPYRLERVLTFLNPKNDPFGTGYQINQILISVGSGGFWGVGPFQGIQKQILPLPMNDSIYAVWAEELGFLGAVALILLFVMLMWRGLFIASSIKTVFPKFTALGITIWFFIQALINIASAIGLFPLTGIPLPFISYGSSSLVTTLFAAGLLLQLSKEA